MIRHRYQVPPIDIWAGTVPVEEFYLNKEIKYFMELNEYDDQFKRSTSSSVRVLMQEAAFFAKYGDWEFDFSVSPRIFTIPFNEIFGLGYAWKQENNGTTFISSPIELPHFKEWEIKK